MPKTSRKEVLAKVSEGLERFRGDAALSTWIFRIATNAALDRLRSRRVRQAALEVSTSPSGSDGAAGRALIDRLPGRGHGCGLARHRRQGPRGGPRLDVPAWAQLRLGNQHCVAGVPDVPL